MPSIQVIDRQEDPTAKAYAALGNDLSETLQKQQSLKLTSQYYKIMAKNADTDAQKLVAEKNAKAAEHLLKMQDLPPEQRGPTAKMLFDAGQLDFNGVHDVGQKAEEYFKIISQPTAEEQASISNKQAESKLHNATADLYANYTKQIAGGEGAPNGGPNGAAVNAVNSTAFPQMTLSGIGPTGPTFTSPQAKFIEASATATGTDTAKRNIARQQFDKDFTDFLAIDDTIQRSHGGMLDRIKTGASTALKGLNQDTPEGQAIAAYDALKKRLRNTLARQVDVGNLSASEQKAAEAAIPSLYDSEGTRQLKIAFIKDINQAIGSNEPSKVKAIIDNYKVSADATKNPNTPRAKALAAIKGNTPGTTPVKKYLRTGTDSTTGKRVGMLADGTIEEIQ